MEKRGVGGWGTKLGVWMIRVARAGSLCFLSRSTSRTVSPTLANQETIKDQLDASYDAGQRQKWKVERIRTNGASLPKASTGPKTKQLGLSRQVRGKVDL